LSYHDSLLIWIVGFKSNRQDYVKKSEDETLFKTADDLLCFTIIAFLIRGLKRFAQIAKLKTLANENVAEFLYVLAPRKIGFLFPAGVDNHSLDN
jgi:hypothetical protein